MVKEGDKSSLGQILCKIPRVAGKSGDITGGLPRVTELFEARNQSYRMKQFHLTRRLCLRLMELFHTVRLSVVTVR